jgi:ABC-2 type transport system permease protein
MNAIPLDLGGASTRAAAMPAGRILRAYLAEAKYESLRMLRTPGFALPLLALPVLLYLLLGALFAGALRADPQGPPFLFVAMAVFGGMGPGIFGFGAVLAVERAQGLLRLKRALPMPPAAYLTAKLFMALLFNAIIMATVAVAGIALGQVRPGAAAAVAAVNVLAALPFCAVGLAIGVLARGQAGAGFSNLVYQVMMWLSGLFFPLPGFLRAVAPVWPAYHVQQLSFAALGGPSRWPVAAHVAVLAGVTLLLIAFAVRRLARVG